MTRSQIDTARRPSAAPSRLGSIFAYTEVTAWEDRRDAAATSRPAGLVAVGEP